MTHVPLYFINFQYTLVSSEYDIILLKTPLVDITELNENTDSKTISIILYKTLLNLILFYWFTKHLIDLFANFSNSTKFD